jgi:hypothetical protein
MENLIKQLRAEIQTAGGGKCLLWVDPAQWDPYEDDEIVGQRRVRVPIIHVRFALRRAPYLVPLDLAVPGDAELFNGSVERAWDAWAIGRLRASRGQPICGWVVTNASAQTVANHWGRHCHLHGHQYKSKLLRFHDPGVREWLWPTLNEAQRHALLGPAACLFALGRNQGLMRHASDSSDVTPAPFRLDDQQWRQVGDYATLHAAWVACASALAGPFCAQAVLDALVHATRAGVMQDSERELYAMHALQLGTRFYTDVRMKPVWNHTRTGGYYGSAVEDVFGCSADELHLQRGSHEEKTAWPT